MRATRLGKATKLRWRATSQGNSCLVRFARYLRSVARSRCSSESLAGRLCTRRFARTHTASHAQAMVCAWSVVYPVLARYSFPLPLTGIHAFPCSYSHSRSRLEPKKNEWKKRISVINPCRRRDVELCTRAGTSPPRPVKGNQRESTLSFTPSSWALQSRAVMRRRENAVRRMFNGRPGYDLRR